MGPEELEEAGVYDPSAPFADDRLEALQLLVVRGATLSDLVANRDDLGYLAGRIANGGVLTMTLPQLAARAGLPLDLVQRLSRATGLPDLGDDELAANESDLILFETFGAAVRAFGEDMSFQLARVVGSSVARMADAIISAFVTTISPQVTADDPSGLAIVRANFDLVELRGGLMATVEQLLLRHLVNSARPQGLTSGTAGYESQRIAVGFVDLVGSTRFAGLLGIPELGRAMTEFESTASDIVVRHHGRVVKLIGDEIMFIADDPAVACRVASDLVQAFHDHEVLPPVRAGVAFGDVLRRDGDCFGPTVNLAARVVAVAGASEVVVDQDTARAAGVATQSLGPVELKGFDEAVVLERLSATPDRGGRRPG
jgi:adenylate cyclase